MFILSRRVIGYATTPISVKLTQLYVDIDLNLTANFEIDQTGQSWHMLMYLDEKNRMVPKVLL